MSFDMEQGQETRNETIMDQHTETIALRNRLAIARIVSETTHMVMDHEEKINKGLGSLNTRAHLDHHYIHVYIRCGYRLTPREKLEKTVELASIEINAGMRRCGVGGKVLGELEKVAAKHGRVFIIENALYDSSMGQFDSPLIRLVKKRGGYTERRSFGSSCFYKWPCE